MDDRTVRRGRGGRARGAAVLACAMAGLLGGGLGGCVTNPETGRSILALQGQAWEIDVGNQMAPQFTQEMGGEVPDAQLQAYVRGIGERMVPHVHESFRDYPWEFNFVNTDQINAFALPGGKVFFTRGLASKMTNEAQMAGVIGHEIGHVTAQHGNQRISQTMILSGAAGLAAVLVDASGNSDASAATYGIPALMVGGQLVMLRFGRDEELEADRLGVRYMVAEGYDPVGQRQVMEILGSLSGGNDPPEFLSTHPASETRVAAINKLIAEEYAFTQNNPEFKLYEERFRTQFLARLAQLPPAPDAARVAERRERLQRMLAADPAAFDLNDPTTWCATCRAEALARAESGASGARGAAGVAHAGHGAGIARGGEEAGEVPPREGVYRFVAHPAR
jgi:predicted Zn-dependent protease